MSTELNTNSNPSSSRALRRWRVAYNAIRFIVSASPRPFTDHHLPFVAVDKPKEYSYHLKNSLTLLTKDRNLQFLADMGGVRGLALKLGTDLKCGLSTETILGQKKAFGSNVCQNPPKRSFLSFVLEALMYLTTIRLLICRVLFLGLRIKQYGLKEGWYLGAIIITPMLVVVLVSALINFKQSRQFDKLSKESSNIQVKALRDGRCQHVSIFDVVVGEIVFLRIGDQVPADGLVLDGHCLKVDESSMTGENDRVDIDEANNPFLISGTKVTDGYGRMVVTSVGMNTLWGQTMSSVSQDSVKEMPLQRRLTKLTSFIGKVGLLVALLVLIVLLIRYFTGHTKDENGNRKFNGKKTTTNEIMNEVINIVSAAVTLVVVAIPEGLPLAMTSTLAYSIKRMMADNAMVRKLSACETMGSTTTICTHKTGTLTLNQMTVTEFWQGKEVILNPQSLANNVLELLRQAVGLNTTGRVCQSSSESVPEVSGSPTEQAILSWAVFDLKMEMDALNQSFELLHAEAFNSEKKRRGVMVKQRRENRAQVHWKGAAEIILAKCCNYYDQSGMLVSIEDEDRTRFREIIESMAAKSLRCVAFAHKQIREDDNTKQLDESGLTLLGIVGLKDPCRSGVREAVESCRKGGVNVKMVTGDNIFTAKAIARECGILEEKDEIQDEAVIEGMNFRNCSQEERMQKVDHIRVIARSSPTDKLLMVQCLKQKGHVVAVTGDIPNDCPAFQEADIGLSMGIQGTEVAKESSDIVILDDNFASVVAVLRWGRCVYNSIQKFIQFQLTVNAAAIVINFVALVSSGNIPLTVVQLTWVNMIITTLGAIALATEPPSDALMGKSPVGKTGPLITKDMRKSLAAQASYQIGILLTLHFKGKSIFHVSHDTVLDTLIFSMFVFLQVFNEFNAWKLEQEDIFQGIRRSKYLIGAMGMILLLQIVMVEFLPGYGRLSWGQWLALIVIASSRSVNWMYMFQYASPLLPF